MGKTRQDINSNDKNNNIKSTLTSICRAVNIFFLAMELIIINDNKNN